MPWQLEWYAYVALWFVGSIVATWFFTKVIARNAEDDFDE